MRYRHTQIGYLMIGVIIFVILLLGFTIIVEEQEYSRNLATAILTILILVLASFSTLSVKIDKDILNIKFGYGLFRKNFSLNDIKSAKVVKNKWYYGWGIRFWFWPKMIIYNVSGFNAVEIVTKNGNVYRIGTDEPEVLVKEILKTR